ncbi:sulfurtransferase [Pseudonocardia asaccharolytica]|uniref:Sulfurtransferase n=1 Tax=Pseudonocardia asaccharolytica DSM 44247 = NBRC 16224 TaxID=1123024 RepID=A0A511D376_9PSEU|nr:sulfurtransferase [Pseudonocardia asaccharolytica]GEL18973.1 sulfurtransferase [Pseudonocardia asaccharolytica DSM 44247 = NBRC 16224]
MSPLLTPTDLARWLSRRDLRHRPVVLDVRWRLGGPPAKADYETGHLSGAVYVDLDTELAGAPGAGGRHPLPSPERLGAVLRGAGVRADSAVVAYDDGNGSVAARAWWLLRWAGLAPEQVAVLDGGFAAWVAEGRAVSAEPVDPEPGDVVVRPGGMPVLDVEAAAELARTGILLDARAEARYRGDTEPVDSRAGHIPGARNAPATGNVGPDGRWLDPEALAARFAALGVDGTGAVGAYCGSGVNAAALVLALEHAGLAPEDRPAGLYVGSWSQWSADPTRPAATGSRP